MIMREKRKRKKEAIEIESKRNSKADDCSHLKSVHILSRKIRIKIQKGKQRFGKGMENTKQRVHKITGDNKTICNGVKGYTNSEVLSTRSRDLPPRTSVLSAIVGMVACMKNLVKTKSPVKMCCSSNQGCGAVP